MPFERGAQRPQVQVAVDTAELLARLHHPGRAPAQRHLPIAPALDVRAAITTNADHRLEALLSNGSCQAAALRSAGAVEACRSASFHMCRMMTLASCRLWHRRASRLLLFSRIFRARYSLAGGWQRA